MNNIAVQHLVYMGGIFSDCTAVSGFKMQKSKGKNLQLSDAEHTAGPGEVLNGNMYKALTR